MAGERTRCVLKAEGARVSYNRPKCKEVLRPPFESCFDCVRARIAQPECICVDCGSLAGLGLRVSVFLDTLIDPNFACLYLEGRQTLRPYLYMLSADDLSVD